MLFNVRIPTSGEYLSKTLKVGANEIAYYFFDKTGE